MNKYRFLALISAIALAACGATNDESSGGTDGGTQGGGDAGEQVTGGLSINVPLGISLIDVPPIGFSAVDGEIIVKRDGETINTATVTINGVALTTVEGLDYYSVDADQGVIPDAEPGKVLKIVAKDGDDTVEMSLPCPTEVAFTAPAEGSQIAAGQSVNFTWNGKIGPYALGYAAEPYLQLWGNEPSAEGDHPYSLGMPSEGENYSALHASDTGATLTMPAVLDKPAYLVKLYVPSDEVKSGADDFGYCKLVRTLHLTK